MTRDVIPGSRYKTYQVCCNMLFEHSKKTGIPYEPPHGLEAATCILMHYVKTGDRLYKDNPWTYTYSQYVDKDGVLVVGGFGSSGLNICYGDCYDGVAGFRMLA